MKLYTKILIGMMIGIVAGLLLGPNSSLLSQDGVHIGGIEVHVDVAGQPGATVESLASGVNRGLVTGEVVSREDSEWKQIQWQLTPADQMRLQSEMGSPVSETEVVGWVDTS